MTDSRMNSRFVGLDRLLRVSHMAAISLPEQALQRRLQEQEALLARCSRLLDAMPEGSRALQCLRADLSHHLFESQNSDGKAAHAGSLRANSRHVLSPQQT